MGMGKGYKQADRQDACEDCAGVRATELAAGGVVVFWAVTDRTARTLETMIVEKRMLAVLLGLLRYYRREKRDEVCK